MVAVKRGSPKWNIVTVANLVMLAILLGGYAVVLRTVSLVDCNPTKSGPNSALIQPRAASSTNAELDRTLKTATTSATTSHHPSGPDRSDPFRYSKKLPDMPTPFNPWNDFIFEKATDSSKPYSSFECVSAGPNERRSLPTSRICWFQNLYYHPMTMEFHYYASPQESAFWKASRAQMEDEMGTTISYVRDSGTNKTAWMASHNPYYPTVHTAETALPESVSTLRVAAAADSTRNPLFMLFRTSMPNFGHIIWDDFQSLFTQLDAHDLQDDDTILPIPFLMNPKEYIGGNLCFPRSGGGERYAKCAKMYKRIYPYVWNMATDCSGDLVRNDNWLRGNDAIGVWKEHPKMDCGTEPYTNSVDTDYVLIPNMTVGNGRSALFGCYGECTNHRGPQLLRFRNYMIARMFQGDPLAINPIGFITFSLPLGASRGAGEAYHFETEIAWAKERYGENVVKAVDLASLNMQEQTHLVGNSAVYFTNHGGGSASTTFLPKHSAAIVYWVGYQRDIDFYNTAGYFRTRWVSKGEKGKMWYVGPIVEAEIQKTARFYPNMISAEAAKREAAAAAASS